MKKESYILFAAGPTSERGGPAKYVRELSRLLPERGYQVKVVHFTLFRSLIPGLRHLLYLLRLLRASKNASCIIAFDTWSVGIPAAVVSKLTGIPLIIRVGGDYLWEAYVERTGTAVRLSDFYNAPNIQLSLKERLIKRGTRWLTRQTDIFAFNTEWQASLWKTAYAIPEGGVEVIENMYPAQSTDTASRTNVFVSAGRETQLKQTKLVEAAFREAQKHHPEYTLDTRSLSPLEHAERLRTCHAVIQGSVSDIAPNSVIEASAYGTPFICTDDTGIQDRLEGRGVFINTTTQENLTTAIRQFMEADSYAEALKRATAPGFERSWDEVVSDLMALLKEKGVTGTVSAEL